MPGLGNLIISLESSNIQYLHLLPKLNNDWKEECPSFMPRDAMCESASAHKVPAVHRVIRRAWLGGLGRNSEEGHQRKLPSLQWQLCPHFWTCFLPWTPWPSPTVLWCLLSCSQPLGHNTCLLEDASSCEAAWGSSSSPVFHCYLISHIIIFHCVVRSLITDKINLIFKIFFPNFYCHQLLLSSTLHILEELNIWAHHHHL